MPDVTLILLLIGTSLTTLAYILSRVDRQHEKE